jgi:transposase
MHDAWGGGQGVGPDLAIPKDHPCFCTKYNQETIAEMGYTNWEKEGTMRAPIVIPNPTPEAIEALAKLYRTTRDVRLRTRTQIVLLAAEQRLTAPAIAQIVREDDQTVRTWLKRYLSEGIEGLKDRPMPGAPSKITPAYVEQLLQVVRRRPRSLGLPYSLWTLQRLADYLAEQTGIRVSYETIRQLLKAREIVLSRPQHQITSPDPEYLVKKRRLKRPVIT